MRGERDNFCNKPDGKRELGASGRDENVISELTFNKLAMRVIMY
jgi:hypothetical protein